MLSARHENVNRQLFRFQRASAAGVLAVRRAAGGSGGQPTPGGGYALLVALLFVPARSGLARIAAKAHVKR
jgi:hypothetical protein